MIKQIQRNPVPSLLLAGVLASLLFSKDNIRQNASAIDGARQITQQNTANQLQLQAIEQSTQQRAKIAAARYQAGCVVVVALNAPNQFTSITEGQPVLDRARNVPLPVNTVVCDAIGNTAVIAPGPDGTPVASQLAFTGDRSVVEAAINGVPAQLHLPQQ